MINAPHTLDPDALEDSKNSKVPHWRTVFEKEEVGSGENRMELYPLRHASTERQYMVYFPDFACSMPTTLWPSTTTVHCMTQS